VKHRLAKFVVHVLGCVAFFAAAANRQNAQTPPATAVIAGTVVDSITRQPLGAIEVRARSFAPGQSSPHTGSATTDAEGHFILDAMAPGRYAIYAMHPGYVGQRVTGAGSSGRMFTVAPDQHLNDLVIELIPGANISGHVKNGDGKPMSGVSFEVVKYFQNGAMKELHGVGAPSFTNAAGEYHVAGVAPGRYYFRAIPPNSSSAGAAAAKEAFAPTYYPNSADVTSAAPLTVRPGQDLAGMDVTMTPVHAVTVAGRVLVAGAATASPGASVTLINNDASSFQRETITDAKGNFELQGVPSGAYVLVARVEPQTKTSKMLWGQKAVHVGDSNLSKADVMIGPGVQVGGRIHFDEKANLDLTRVTVTLETEGNASVSALMPDVESVSVRPDGTFTFTGVPEGTHLLNFSSLPAGYYLKSTGAVDVLESGVTVAHNQSPPMLDLTLSPNPAQLTGTVSNDQMPVPGAFVVLIPQGARGGQSRFYRRSRTDQSGRFSMREIVSGDYKVLAFEGLERGSLTEEFLQPFEDRGELVHLQEGGTVSVTLDAITADETSP